MENKKLLKFLLKDIAEIEELFTEKGHSGFDDYEIEFLRSRFEGARQIIHILNEKDDAGLPEAVQPEEKKEKGQIETPVIQEEEEVIIAVVEEQEESVSEIVAEVALEQEPEEEIKIPEPEKVSEIIPEPEVEIQTEIVVEEEPGEPREKEEYQRLGDRFVKEKSLNELLANGSNNLENKISNSPVNSLQGAIGINDRYIYIRELFNGSGETFLKAVTELDRLSNIKEAVAYLQQNYKWKKTDASLKFVNLVKRRFPNG